MNFFILSLLAFDRCIAVRRKVLQFTFSACSPRRAERRGTRTRATPTRIEQRAEKLSILGPVIREEQSALRQAFYRRRDSEQYIYARTSPLVRATLVPLKTFCDTRGNGAHKHSLTHLPTFSLRSSLSSYHVEGVCTQNYPMSTP